MILLAFVFLSLLNPSASLATALSSNDPIVGVWHAPSNFFGDSITALLQFQPDGTATSRDSIDFGSGGSGEFYGGNQGVWEKASGSTDANSGRHQYVARAIEIVYNKTTGEPTDLSMSRAIIVLNDDVDDMGRLTLKGTLNIRRSPCAINDCNVPDMALVDTEPMFVINITGTKILEYSSSLGREDSLTSSSSSMAKPISVTLRLGLIVARLSGW